MKRWLIVATVLSLAAPVFAQNGADGSDQNEPPRRQRRERRNNDGGPGQRGGFDMNAMSERLASQLDLTDEQRPRYDAIVKNYQDKMREALGGSTMVELMDEMREARQNGNNERVQEIRQQLRDAREQTQPLMGQFFDEVNAVLTPEQSTKLTEIRDRMQRMGPGGPGGPGGFGGRMLDRMAEDLNLDPKQQAQYDQLAEGLRAKLAEQGGAWRDLQPLFQQLREARDAGDEDKAAQIQSQIDERRPRNEEDFAQFFDQVEKFLNDEQKATLSEMRDRMRNGGFGGPGGPGGQRGRELDVQTILRAVRRLELSDEQRDQIKEIGDEAMRSNREARDREGRANLTALVRERILKVLDADQKAQFEQSLQRARGGGRGERGADGERPRRRARDEGEQPSDAQPKGEKPSGEKP